MISYDPHHWIHHFFDIKGSMLREIVGRVFLSVLWSILVVYFHYHFYPIDVPTAGHSLVGVAMGLLLVFRTNSSYDRFWEGRKLWGSIINESRNLGRLARVLLKKDPELFHKLIYWNITFVYSTMYRLRGENKFGQVHPEIQERSFQIHACSHYPLAASVEMTNLINEARNKNLISEYFQVSLDQNIQLLIDYLGACERIRATPLPFAYVVHLRRALLIFCFSLPFALVDSFAWTTPLVTFLIAFVFFGIEEIGVEIEDPFGRDDNDLPLEKFCELISKNLLDLRINSTLT